MLKRLLFVRILLILLIFMVYKGYDKDVKVIVYPHGSHLNGLMPNKKREKKLYRTIPLIGLMYKTFGKYLYKIHKRGYLRTSD